MVSPAAAIVQVAVVSESAYLSDRVRQRRGNAVARSLNYGNEEEEEDIFLSTPVRVVSDPLLTPQKSILKTPGEHCHGGLPSRNQVHLFYIKVSTADPLDLTTVQFQWCQ